MAGTPQIINMNSASTTTSANGTQVTTIIVNHAGGMHGGNAGAGAGDANAKPSMFCLMCDSTVNEPRSIQGRNGTGVSGLQIPNEDKVWARKYHKFLCKEYKISLPGVPTVNGVEQGSGFCFSDQVFEDRVPFCSNCKSIVEALYESDLAAQAAVSQKETLRDEVAKMMTKVYINRQYEQDSTTEWDENQKEIAASKIFLRWKKIFTGVAAVEAKEQCLLNEIKELATQSALKEQKTRLEFPEGTGLSALELAKMQRVMTACYFTPKMSVVRRRNKLLFQVGIPKAKDDKAFKCTTCDATFPYQRSLTIHNRAHKLNSTAKKKLHKCISCGELFLDRKDLVIHKRHHLPIEKRLREAEKQYPCSSCGVRFRSKTARSVHFNRSHLHRCDICQDSFSYASTLDLHKQIHEHKINGTDLISCKQCSKAFLKPENLLEHLKLHMDQKLIPCAYCGKGFESQELVLEHFASIHVEPNPYNCEVCDIKVESEEQLIQHMTSHKVQYQTCEVCGKIYRSRDGLKKHNAIHTSGKILP